MTAVAPSGEPAMLTESDIEMLPKGRIMQSRSRFIGAHAMCWRLCALAFTIALCPVIQADDRLPIPDKAAQKKADDLVQAVFGEQIKAATRPDAKLALVKKMLQEASRPNVKAADRYALMRSAIEVAPDAHVAMSIIEEMATHFNIAELTAKAYTIRQLAESADSPSQRRAIAESAMGLAHVYVQKDSFEAALKLVELAMDAAMSNRDPSLIHWIREKEKGIASLRRKYAEVKTALATLATNPTDSKSNLLVGRYKCFDKGEWKDGLPMLALGDDEVLRNLAAKEQSEPKISNEQVALADGWYDLAPLSADTKERMLERAVFWYQLSLKSAPALPSLVRAKVEKRLSETVHEPPPEAPRELTVLQAKYGSNDGWVDVTGQMKAKLRDSRLVVTKAGIGLEDPKSGHHKVLVMVVSYGGNCYSVYVPQDEAVILPTTPQMLVSNFKHVRMKQLARPNSESRLSILDAQWGAYNGWLDVTQVARQAVRDSKLDVVDAGRGLKDPAFGRDKALVLIYAVDDEIHIATVPHRGAAVIP